EFGESVPPRGGGRRADATRLAPLHGRDRRRARLPPRRAARAAASAAGGEVQVRIGADSRGRARSAVGVVPAALRPQADAVLRALGRGVIPARISGRRGCALPALRAAARRFPPAARL